MSIYSTNRSGSVALSSLAANESYRSTDLGRILYESQVNDRIMFEAVLASDFREIKGLREGTLVQSEISALNEASIKSFFANIKKRLEAFWQKIKGAIKNAITKISAYIFKDGKAFAANYRKFAENHKNAKISEVKGMLPNFDLKIAPINIADLEGLINKNKNNESVDKKKIIGIELGKTIGESDSYTPQEYRNYINKNAGTEGKITSGSTALIEKMLKYIEDASTSIKDMKETERVLEKAIKATGTSIKNAERELGKNDGTDHSKIITNISILVSACETIISTVCASNISLTKARVKYSRSILGKIMSETRKSYDESAAIAAEDEVDMALEDMPGETVDPEVEEAVAEIVNSMY